MIEKRFYYNTFYYPNTDRVMEYEIIDRESFPNYPNYDETEEIPNWYFYINENDSNWQDMCIDKLNELHEENQSLKQQLKTKHIVNKQYEELQRLKEENSVLKLNNKILIEMVQGYQKWSEKRSKFL